MGKMRKQFVALTCAAAMVITALPLTSTLTAEATTLDGLADLSRQVSAEGCVLIKNDNDVLPLEGGESISVFGRAQCNYYKSGTGSGGAVVVPYVTGILEGLRKNPKVKINEKLAQIYADWVEEHPFDDGGGGWAAEPWYQEEMPLTEEIVDEAAANSETALVIIGRTAGEDKDNKNVEGSYQLTQKERDMLQIVTEKFDKVAVVLNVANICDMKWVDEYDVDSVLYAWQGGMSGGDGVADVLTGDVNPSGRLTDTIAYNYSDYPSAANFGRTDYNYYKEDIYVGYRYFETFAQEDVMYPFGYGLSYTTFETSTYSVTQTEDEINVFTTVENTGDRAGKETVQVYYGAPQGELGNPVKELAAFAKTKLLQPGESQDITLTFKIDDMASYDDGGYTGHDSCYVLEAGDYQIYVGNDVRDSRLEYTYVQPELEVVEELQEEMAPIKPFQRMKPELDENGNYQITYEDVPLKTVDVTEKIEANLPEEIPQTGDQGYKLIDVYNGDVTMEQFVAQLSNEELTSLVRGEGMSPANVTAGVAAAFGGVNTTGGNLTDLYGIPRASAADGPSGIRQSGYATSLPNGASLACTWNVDLVERLFQLEGEEMVLNNIDTILGPGINLHRNPLNGRNFEYYSEDPLLTGMMAAAVTKGVQSTGATVTLKHFVANNQETNRHRVDSRVSERALRELYLKCFQIPVETAAPRSIMTSYNPVNGDWTASSYDLATDILRKEWGFEGIVMTDWWAEMNKNIASGKTPYGTQYLASMVKSQNDIYMVTPDSSRATNNSNLTIDIPAMLESGYLKVSELQRCAINICNYLLKSQAFARLNGLEFVPYFQPGESWFTVEKSEMGNPRLTQLMVGDREVSTFQPYVLEYKVYSPADRTELPQVSGVAANGATVQIEQASKESPVAKVTVSAGGEETIYRVIFTEEEGLTPVFDNPIYAALDDIQVNGETIAGFDSNIYDYAIPVDSISGTPQITFTAPENVEASMTYDEEEKLATIKCTTEDQVKYYRVRFGVRPQSDDFNGEELSSFWSIESENPDNWSLTDGKLVINSEGGSFYQDQNNMHNQFVQPAFGDWEVVAKLDVEKLPWTNYQGIGIVAKEDDDNYIYLKTEWSSRLAISFTQETNGTREILEELGSEDLAKFTDTIYFKLKKIGNTYTAAVSPDGENYIRFNVPASAEYSNPKFALVAGNGSAANAESIAANFDYVTFNTSVKAPVFTIGESAKLKVAEVEPVAISKTMKPEACSDEDGGLNFGNCDKGEYATYNVNVEKTGVYDFTARMASGASDTAQVKFIIYIDDEEATSFVTNGTGGWQNWITSNANKVKLNAGEHKLKIYFDMAGMNLNWIQMDLAEEVSDEALREAIERAENLDVSAYPAVRREEFAKALAAAKTALQEAMSQKAVDEALATLKMAESNLGVKVPITSIQLNTADVTLNPNTSMTLRAEAAPAGYTDQLVWSSSNQAVARVDENGMVTGLAEGTAIITVSNGGAVKATCTVTVKKYDPAEKPQQPQKPQTESYISDVNATCGKDSLYYGGNKDKKTQVSVSVPAGAVIESVEYTTSNAKAATVNVDGTVTAKGKGKAVIGAKVTLTNGESKTFHFNVTVKKASIQKVKVPKSVKKGKKMTLKAKALGTGKKVTWKLTKNTKAAKLTKSGKFTAIRKGKVKVTAKAGSIKKTFTIRIK